MANTNANAAAPAQAEAAQGTATNQQAAAGTEGEAKAADTALDDVCVVTDGKGPQAGNIVVGKPAAGEGLEVQMAQGHKYFFDFSEGDVKSFELQDGNLKMSFADGSTILLVGYEKAAAGAGAATMAFRDEFSTDNIKVVETVKSEDVPAEGEAKAKAPKDLLETEQHAQAQDGEKLAKVEPAAGEDAGNKAAQALADIEPAAGEAGGGTGGTGNTGYGIGSSFDPQGVIPLNDVGPIGPTALKYGVEFPLPELRVPEEEGPRNPVPEIAPSEQFVDETDLSPDLSVSGIVQVEFGTDGPGTITPNGGFTFNGSIGVELTSAGVPVVVSATADGYVGIAGGVTVFQLVINPATGEYTFTQFEAIDHADASDANDVINLVFGVVATDGSGDQADTTITIGVADDAPMAAAPMAETIDEAALLGGPIVVSDSLTVDFGNDTPGTVTPNGASSFAGVAALTTAGHAITITATANGYVGTYNGGANTAFELVVNPATGAYTYTQYAALDHDISLDTISLTFGTNVTDYDGDHTYTTITINIDDSVPEIPHCSEPTIGRGYEIVDETNLGPNVVSGDVVVNFGADVPGAITADGAFTSSVTLYSNGQPVTVTAVAGGYVGTAAGSDVFTLTVDNAGHYVFTQLAAIDHPDASNPDDVIRLNFGIQVTDADGDTDNGTIIVDVRDDGPSVSTPPMLHLHEDALDPGPAVVNGTVAHDFGNDGAGALAGNGASSFSGVAALTSGGQAVTITQVAGGYTGSTVGGDVFTLTIDPATGDYQFTLLAPLDHAPGDAPIILNFGVNVTDFDADSVSTTIAIKVKDDTPTIEYGDDPLLGKGFEIVDETDLGPVVVGGSVPFSFGADGPGALSFTGVNNISGVASLTSGGQPVSIVATANGFAGVAGGVTVFELTLNTGTGVYNFTQYGVLDHPDATNPNDAITLSFGIRVTDADGDSDTGQIRIEVRDDGPVAHDDVNGTYDVNGVAMGNVISGLNGGPGAADDLSNDHDNTVIKIVFKGVEYDVPAAGTVSVNGDYGVLEIAADGSYTYTSTATGGGSASSLSFSETLSFPALAEGVEISGPALDNLGVASGVLSISEPVNGQVTYLSEHAGYDNTLGMYTIAADGSILPASFIIANGNNAVSGENFAFSAVTGQSIGFFVIADGFGVNGGYAGLDLANGTLQFVYKYGTAEERAANVNDVGGDVSLVFTDGSTAAETVLGGAIYHTTERGGSDAINSDSSVRVLTGLADAGDDTVLRISFEDLPNLGDKDYDDIVFDLTLSPKDCGCLTDQFGYVLQDGDGDTSAATLTLECVPTDDTPILATVRPLTVDETDILGAAPIGSDSDAAVASADFGGDGPGIYSATGLSTFGATGHAGSALTSNGVPVTVTLEGGAYVGKAGGTTVFTLAINPTTGAYNFTLLGQLDHADKTNPNDVIKLSFGLTATDADGDSDDGIIVVNVLDDGPVAVDDGKSVLENTLIASGNVLANDHVGEDAPGVVTSVSFNGADHAVAQGSATVVAGQYGTLSIGSDGAYTYTSYGTNTAQVVDHFVYTLVDADGDADQAKLEVTIKDVDYKPEICVYPLVVDETDILGAAPIGSDIDGAVATVSGLGNDGPATFGAAGTGTFSYSGHAGSALTSNGVPVAVTLDGSTYVGKAGGTTVFTLAINPTTGAYDFTLLGQLDHADKTNPNDVIQLSFGMTVTDADGDSDTGNVVVKVYDDGPDAKDDYVELDAAKKSASGNVIANDIVGEDEPGSVAKVVFNGVYHDILPGQVNKISGSFGELSIKSDGSYTYTLYDGARKSGSYDIFYYKLADADGDIDVAMLKFKIIEPVLIVGDNVDDVKGSTTPWVVGSGKEVITGGKASDVLVGDVGGAKQIAVDKDYNFLFVLDVSGSMGDKKDANSRISLLVDAVQNLIGDLGDYQGGDVKVHFTPFSTTALTGSTFTVTDAQGLADAISWLESLTGSGFTNYESALQAGVNWLQSGELISGAETYTYFVSDGEPNRYVTNDDSSASGSADTVMGQITGTDGTDEVSILHSLSDEVIGVGIDIGSTIARINVIDSDGVSINVEDPADLTAVLAGTNPLNKLVSVGDDHLVGGEGDDLIFGDTLYTDDLAAAQGLGVAPGSGWETFQRLENGEGHDAGWSRQDTLEYIRTHAQELAHESTDSSGDGRTGGDDVIHGGTGNDIIFGQEGHDVIAGGAGEDLLYGGSGSDTFLYQAIGEGVDTIGDFALGEDVMDVSALLQGFDALQDSINDFVFATQVGGNTVVSVDADGTAGGASAVDIAVLQSVTGLTLADIVDLTNNGKNTTV